jgi:glycerophosphoryl diester phosphodiesterase
MAGALAAPLGLTVAAHRALAWHEADGLELIAHRGGIVDDQHAENSLASVDAAIARGYWMIEVDVRRTKDGRAFLNHDDNFRRYYDDPRRSAEMTWDEVSQLRAPGDGHSPLTFEQLCAHCEGRIRLMLDIKANDAPPSFHEDLVKSLERHKLLESTYILTDGGAHDFWRAHARMMRNAKEVRALVAEAGPAKEQFALFEVAGALDEESVRFAQQHGVTVVAALNTFRYARAADDQQAAAADAARLRAIGVRQFQIDSVYERHFR